MGDYRRAPCHRAQDDGTNTARRTRAHTGAGPAGSAEHGPAAGHAAYRARCSTPPAREPHDASSEPAAGFASDYRGQAARQCIAAAQCEHYPSEPDACETRDALAHAPDATGRQDAVQVTVGQAFPHSRQAGSADARGASTDPYGSARATAGYSLGAPFASRSATGAGAPAAGATAGKLGDLGKETRPYGFTSNVSVAHLDS